MSCRGDIRSETCTSTSARGVEFTFIYFIIVRLFECTSEEDKPRLLGVLANEFVNMAMEYFNNPIGENRSIQAAFLAKYSGYMHQGLISQLQMVQVMKYAQVESFVSGREAFPKITSDTILNDAIIGLTNNRWELKQFDELGVDVVEALTLADSHRQNGRVNLNVWKRVKEYLVEESSTDKSSESTVKLHEKYGFGTQLEDLLEIKEVMDYIYGSLRGRDMLGEFLVQEVEKRNTADHSRISNRAYLSAYGAFVRRGLL